MDSPVNVAEGEDSASVPTPEFLKILSRPISLLPGEDRDEFNAIREVIVREISPQSGIEWLWTFDLIELSWDIQRYRALRQKVLETHRQNAIEHALRRLDCSGIPSASQALALSHVERNAVQWREDPEAALQIEARLASYGIDARSIDMEVIVQAREIFLMFDSLMHSAQNRRICLLREINARRILVTQVRNSNRKRS